MNRLGEMYIQVKLSIFKIKLISCFYKFFLIVNYCLSCRVLRCLFLFNLFNENYLIY